MLVLTRTCDEEIRIGDEVIIRVLDVKGDRVRIGIQAPANVPVHRQEVYEEIERANRQSLAPDAAALAGARRLLERPATADKLTSKSGVAPGERSRATGQEPRRGGSTEVKHGT